MEFFTRVLSGNSRLKERVREADDINQAFKANLDILQRLLESEESSDIVSLLDMVYDSSFPEEQIFMKTPNRARLPSKKELVLRLLIGLDALGIPVMAELLVFVKKHGMEAIAASLLTLLELLAPLLAGKEVPEFTTDDMLDAMDLEWHSSSRAMSPLLSAIASVTSSPRASAASASDSPFHSMASASPYRRAFSDRSMLLSQSHEIGAKSNLDGSFMEPSSSYKLLLTNSTSSQYSSTSSQYPLNREIQPHIQNSSSSSQLSDSKPMSTPYSLETVPPPPQPGLQRRHRRKSSSLRELFTVDTIDESTGEGSTGTSSKRNSASSSQLWNSSEMSKYPPMVNDFSPTLNPVFPRGERRSFGTREEGISSDGVARIPAHELHPTLLGKAKALDNLVTSSSEDTALWVSLINESKGVSSNDEGDSSPCHDVFYQPIVNCSQDEVKTEDGILLFPPSNVDLDDTAMSSKPAAPIIILETTNNTNQAMPHDQEVPVYNPVHEDFEVDKQFSGAGIASLSGTPNDSIVDEAAWNSYMPFDATNDTSFQYLDQAICSANGKSQRNLSVSCSEISESNMSEKNTSKDQNTCLEDEVKHMDFTTPGTMSPELDAHGAIALMSTGNMLPVVSLHDPVAKNLENDNVYSFLAHELALSAASHYTPESITGEFAGDCRSEAVGVSVGDISPLSLQDDVGDEHIEPENLGSPLADCMIVHQVANDHGAGDKHKETENSHSLLADEYDLNGANNVFQHLELAQQTSDSCYIKDSSSVVEELEISSDDRLSNRRRKDSTNELHSVELLDNVNIKAPPGLCRSQSDLTPVRATSKAELFLQKKLDGSQTDGAYFEEISGRFANRLSSAKSVAMETCVSSPDQAVKVVMHKSMPWIHERNQKESEGDVRENRSMSDVSVDESDKSIATPCNSKSLSSSASPSWSSSSGLEDVDDNTQESVNAYDSDKEKNASQSSSGDHVAGIYTPSNSSTADPISLGPCQPAIQCCGEAADRDGLEKGLENAQFTDNISELPQKRGLKNDPIYSQLHEGGFPCSTATSIILCSSGNEPQDNDLHTSRGISEVATSPVDGASVSLHCSLHRGRDKTYVSYVNDSAKESYNDVTSMLPSEDVQYVVNYSVREASLPVLQAITTSACTPTESHNQEVGMDTHYHVNGINHIVNHEEYDAFTIKDIAVDGGRCDEVLLSSDYTDLCIKSLPLREDQVTVAESAPYVQGAATSSSQRQCSPIRQMDSGLITQGTPQQVYISYELARADDECLQTHLLPVKVDKETNIEELEEHLKCSNDQFEQLLSELDTAEKSVSGNVSQQQQKLVDSSSHEGDPVLSTEGNTGEVKSDEELDNTLEHQGLEQDVITEADALDIYERPMKNSDGEALAVLESNEDRTLFPHKSKLLATREAISPSSDRTDAEAAATVEIKDNVEKSKSQLDGDQLLQGNDRAFCLEASEVLDAGNSHPLHITADICARPRHYSSSTDPSLFNDIDKKFLTDPHSPGRPSPSGGGLPYRVTDANGSRDVGCQTDAGAVDCVYVHGHPTSSFQLGDQPRIDTWDTISRVPNVEKKPSGWKSVQKIVANIMCCKSEHGTSP